MKAVLSIAVLFCCCLVALGQENPGLRDELLAMEKVDQAARHKCMNGTAEQQGQCLGEVAKNTDEAHTRRLEEILKSYGFPTRSLVGADGQKAFMILLQHAPTDDVRDKSVEPIKKAFERKELEPQDYANFIDRYLLHKGKRQKYGSGFETKDGKLVLSPTEDVENLDARRKALGLPSMAEYMKMLSETYKLEVILQ